MTAEEMKAAENGAQSAPLPLEGVDISPKQDEGVLKVRGPAEPSAAGSWASGVPRWKDGGIRLPCAGCSSENGTAAARSGGCGPGLGRSPHCNANSIRLHCAAERGGAERESRSRGARAGRTRPGRAEGLRPRLPGNPWLQRAPATWTKVCQGSPT